MCRAKDDIPLVLYTPEATWDDLRKAYQIKKELIERAIGDGSLAEEIQKVPINKKKLVKGRSITKNESIKLNKVNGDDDGWDLEDYGIEVEDENDDKIYYKINSNSINASSSDMLKKVYKYFIQVLEESTTGWWYDQGEIFKKVSIRYPNADFGQYTSMFYCCASYADSMRKAHKIMIDDDCQLGLIFKQSGGKDQVGKLS